MIKFKINGSEIEYPTHWDDVTFEQYALISENADFTRAVSIFLGMPDESVRNSTVEGFESLLEATQFIYNSKPEYPTYTSQIGPFKLPVNKNQTFDIRFESLGQFEDTKAEMRKHPYSFTNDNPPLFIFEDPVKAIRAYARYIAIYLQKIEDGVYIPSKVADMEKRVMKFKASEVIPLGQFFFRKVILLSNGIQTTSLLTNQSPKKSKSGLTTSKTNSVRTHRLTGLRGK